jgi:hypothetical protein
MSNCSGELVNSWCPVYGGGHESAEEMATRLDITGKQLQLMDKIRRDKKK